MGMAADGAGEGTGEIQVERAPAASMRRTATLSRTAAATGDVARTAEQPGPFRRPTRDRGVQTPQGSVAIGPALAADTPFRLQVAPGEAVPHPGWQRARAAALAVLGRGEDVALLGPPGSGKTLLLRDLARALQSEGRSVRLVESGDALDAAPGEDVLLVDDAGRMGVDALARLCATDRPFVLAALPAFAERLARLPRAVTPVALEPLAPEEVARFVAARLAAAGRPRNLLEPDAVLTLAWHSAGLPRLVNVLGGAAVFLADLEDAPRVGKRHVDEAAIREGEDAADPAPSSPEPPAAGIVPRAEPSVASRALPRARCWGRAASAAVAVSLGLLLAGGWVVSGWRPARPPEAARVPGGSGVADESPHGEIDGEPLRARPDSIGHDAGEHPRDVVGTIPAPAEGPPPRRAVQARLPLDDAGAASQQWPATDSAPVIVATFRGPVFNETLNRGGQMSLVVTRRGASSSGAITAHFDAWGGLLGSGELSGRLSEDGRVSASGRLMMGRNPFDCDLSGRIAGGRLTGSATFVRSGGGRTSRSSFSLTGP
jgi:energy-coupling factor transporter ATP-binding protein EcfA2